MRRADSRTWLRLYDSGVPHQVTVPSERLTDALLRSARKWPRRCALWSPRGRLSYHQLLQEVQRFAAVLAGLGVCSSHRVLLLQPNSVQSVVAYYGTLWRGAVAVLTSPESPGPLLEAQIAECAPRVAVAPRPLPEALGEVLRRSGPEVLVLTSLREYTRDLRGWLGVSVARRLGTSRPGRGRLRRWRQEMRRAAAGFPAEPLDPEEPAVIEYTGGTTGTPRGVILSHRALVANALQLSAWDPRMKPGRERILGVLPFSHAYGMTACLNLSVQVGATLLLQESFQVERILELCRRFRPTLFPGIPAYYTALLDRRDLRSHGLDSIRACMSGAAPLPVEIQEAFERVTRGRLVEGDGQTEAAPATHANPLYGERRSGPIGVPLPSTEARIVDLKDRRELPPGKVGELVVRGPQLMKGYWNDAPGTGPSPAPRVALHRRSGPAG